MTLQLDAQQTAARAWFESLRDRICAAFEAIEFRSQKTCKNFWRRSQITLRRDRFDQFTRDDVNVVAVFERGVLKIRMDRDAEVRG